MTSPIKSPDINIMVDIETTGVRYNHNTTGIWQIGAIPIIPGVVGQAGMIFDHTINPLQFIETGRFDEDTIKWQEKENASNWNKAQDITHAGKEEKLIAGFIDYIIECKALYGNIQLWSKGSFDFILLRIMAEHHNLEPSWKYYEETDLRGFCKALNMPVPKFKDAHNAILDATHQAMHLDGVLSHLAAAGVINYE